MCEAEGAADNSTALNTHIATGVQHVLYCRPASFESNVVIHWQIYGVSQVLKF